MLARALAGAVLALCTLVPQASAAIDTDTQGRVLESRQGWLTRYEPDGTVDRTFGDRGSVHLNPAFFRGSIEISAVLVQADGKIVVAAYSAGNGVRAFLARFDPHGKPDPSFGPWGRRGLQYLGPPNCTWPCPAIPYIGALAEDGNGRLLAAGSTVTCTSRGSCNTQGLLVRLLADGSRDEGFGEGGVTFLPSPPDPSIHSYEFRAVQVQPDGRILATGFMRPPPAQQDPVLARFQPDGALDPTFGGGDGLVQPQPPLDGIGLMPDGRILVGGAEDRQFRVSRYLPDGSPDLTYGGGDGVAEATIGAEHHAPVEAPGGMITRGDGSTVLAGTSRQECGPAGTCRLGTVLLAFGPAGEPDPSFGQGDGIARYGLGACVCRLSPPYYYSAQSLAAVGSSIYASGLTALAPGFTTFGLIKTDRAGDLNRDFGRAGIVYSPPPVRCGGLLGSSRRYRQDGTAGADDLLGGIGDDIIEGLGGADRIHADRGNDVVCGAGGPDRIFGGSGQNRLYGGPGADQMYGGDGNDRFFARDGTRDVIRCGLGYDVAWADFADRLLGCERVVVAVAASHPSGRAG